MYQALYRKWRPKCFAEVVGQEHITRTLTNEIASGRHSHAYLFTGSRGTGKTSCAKIFAKAVNCEQPKNGDPCNSCESCLGIDSGSVPDVIEIDAASNTGVDNIREIIDEANFTPVCGKYRVYIIDEVHMLSPGAFNALLKTLEEPPKHVKFILATTEVHKLPATILSRCQRFDFKRISQDKIAERLSFIAKKEGLSLNDDAALLIAGLADGSLRDALSILDQCTALDSSISLATVNETVGLAGKGNLFALSEAILNCDPAGALEIADRLYKGSCDAERLCIELASHYRNLMLCKALKSPRELIVCTADELSEYKKSAEKYSQARILKILKLLSETLVNLKRSLDKRLETELSLIRLCTAEGEGKEKAALQRQETSESKAVSPKPEVATEAKTTKDKASGKADNPSEGRNGNEAETTSGSNAEAKAALPKPESTEAKAEKSKTAETNKAEPSDPLDEFINTIKQSEDGKQIDFSIFIEE